MAIHHAALGFDSSSEVYERGRPELPAAAVDFLTEQLRLAPGTRVADIAAGTGKLTRPLAATGARVMALEPLVGMRRTFRRLLPGVPLAAGIAEALPFQSGTMDAAVAGSAFHWFANATALAEIRRILVPGGRLALLWSVPDRSTPWVAEMLRAIDRHSGDTPLYRKGDWKRAIDAFDGLRDITHAVFPFAETSPPSGSSTPPPRSASSPR